MLLSSVNCSGRVLESLLKISSLRCLSIPNYHGHFFDCCFPQKHPLYLQSNTPLGALDSRLGIPLTPMQRSDQTKVSQTQIAQIITSQNKFTLLSLPFLSYSCWFKTGSALTGCILSCVGNPLYLQHVWVRCQEQEQALMKAQSLPLFLLLLPCLTPGLYKVVPPASLLQVASTGTLQSLFSPTSHRHPPQPPFLSF